MSHRVVRIDKEGLCTLTLNRPEKLNALDTEAFVELSAHLADLEASSDTIGCVVLKGAGRGFCAGADLRKMGTTTVSPTFKPGVIERLNLLPQPVIAAVHGVCYTGGLELVLAADFIVADSSARFADTHGRWGLVSQWGMTQRLPRRVGGAMAKRMMMAGVEVGADEALAMGLVDRVVAQGDLDEEIEAFAGKILANSWHTNFSVKRLLRETEAMPLSEGLAHEHYRHPGFSPDHEARMAAFKK